MSNTLPILMICGPTASGKSLLALEIANNLGGYIINGDSQQQYKDLPILTCCPSQDDYAKVQHELYQYLDPESQTDVASWSSMVRGVIVNNKKMPIVAGGSGFYLRALLTGLSPIPQIPQYVTSTVDSLVQQRGLQSLWNMLKDIDPKGSAAIKRNDHYRLRRALCVFMATGKSIVEWNQTKREVLPDRLAIFKLLILPDRHDLAEKINRRFEKIFDDACEEVRALQSLSFAAPIKRVLGFDEVDQYIKNSLSKNDAIAFGQLKTRQYAKKQITWFSNQITSDVLLTDIYSGQDISSFVHAFHTWSDNLLNKTHDNMYS